MANGNLNTFDDFYTGMLAGEPQMAYMGAIADQPFRGTAPQQQRARNYWSNQFGNVYNQYMGQRAQEMQRKVDPSKWTTFSNFLSQYPTMTETDKLTRQPTSVPGEFARRYAALTPYQRGVSTSRFAPSTRHIYF